VSWRLPRCSSRTPATSPPASSSGTSSAPANAPTFAMPDDRPCRPLRVAVGYDSAARNSNRLCHNTIAGKDVRLREISLVLPCHPHTDFVLSTWSLPYSMTGASSPRIHDRRHRRRRRQPSAPPRSQTVAAYTTGLALRLIGNAYGPISGSGIAACFILVNGVVITSDRERLT
jgi:hypothetical protein